MMASDYTAQEAAAVPINEANSVLSPVQEVKATLPLLEMTESPLAADNSEDQQLIKEEQVDFADCDHSSKTGVPCAEYHLTHSSGDDTGEAPFKCDICGETFCLLSGLHSHRFVHLETDTVSCRVCGKVFSTKAHLEKHIRTHMKENPFSCDLCGEAFKTRRRLLKHTSSHSKESNSASSLNKTQKKQYVRSYCSKTFQCNTHCVEHERIHRNEKPFDCKKCGKAFTTKSSLSKHMATHAGNRKTFPCSKCGMCFSTYYAVAKHRQMHKDRPYMCSDCKKMFASAKKLNKHLQEHNKEEHVCGTCNKRFPTHVRLKKHRESHKIKENGSKHLSRSRSLKKSASLQRHQRSLHQTKAKNTCKYCQKSFKKLSGLNHHLRIHAKAQNSSPSARPSPGSVSKSTKDKYRCGICSNSFETYCRMRQHKQMHQERPYMCDTCEETFETETDLTQHKQSACIDPFVCDKCPKTFPSLKALQRHRIKHVMDKPYLCGICLQSFKSTNQLKAHMLNHLIGEPPSCSFFGKDFTDPKRLQQHQDVCRKKTDSNTASGKQSESTCTFLTNEVESNGLPALHLPEIQNVTEKPQRNKQLRNRENSAFGEQPSNTTDSSSHLTPSVVPNPTEAGISGVSAASLWQQQAPGPLGNQFNAQRQTQGRVPYAIPGFRQDSNSDLPDVSREVDLQRILNLRPTVVLSNLSVTTGTLQQASSHSDTREVSTDAQSSDGDGDIGFHDTLDKVGEDIIEMSCREVFSPGPFAENPDGHAVSQSVTQSVAVSSAGHYFSGNTPVLQLVIDKIQLFTCDICRKDFQSEPDLDQHKSIHQAETPGEIALPANTSIDHSTNSAASLTCFFCKKDFPHYTKLLEHACSSLREQFEEAEASTSVAATCGSKMHANIPRATSVIKCPVPTCKKEFSSLAQLKQHKLSHMKERPHWCDKCDKMFHTKAHLKEHHIREHTSLREFKCQHCHKEFCRKSDLNSHAKTHKDVLAAPVVSDAPTRQVTTLTTNSAGVTVSETEQRSGREGTFVGPLCEEILPEQSRLPNPLLSGKKSHGFKSSSNTTETDVPQKAFPENANSKNRKRNLHECNICGKHFNKSGLLRHLTRHSNERSHKCENCGRAYKQKCHLKFHRTTCDLVGGSSGNGENQSKNANLPCATSVIKCPVPTCKKEFSSLAQLKQHKLSHMKERPHWCDKCDKMFHMKAHLKEHHIREHTNLREFKCQHCHKEFCRKSDLNAHAKTHKDVLAAPVPSDAPTRQVITLFDSTVTGTGNDSGVGIPDTSKTLYKGVSHREPHLRKCNICFEKFPSFASLHQHKRQVHTEERPFKCDKCDKIYRTKGHLKEHQLLTHFNFRKFKCPICCRGFARKREVDRHIQTHRGNRERSNLTSPVRNGGTREGSNKQPHGINEDLSLHLSSASKEGTAEASLSGAKPNATEVDAVIVHQSGHLPLTSEVTSAESHTGADCDQPAQALKTSNAFKGTEVSLQDTPKATYVKKGTEMGSQKRDHSPPSEETVERRGTTRLKIWTCRFCGKICQHHSRLVEHERVHTKERPFKCDHCGRAYAQRSVLHMHLKKVHKMPLPPRKSGRKSPTNSNEAASISNRHVTDSQTADAHCSTESLGSASGAVCPTAGLKKAMKNSSKSIIEVQTPDETVAADTPERTCSDTGSNKTAVNSNDGNNQAVDSNGEVESASGTLKAASDSVCPEVAMLDMPEPADPANPTEVRLPDASEGADDGDGNSSNASGREEANGAGNSAQPGGDLEQLLSMVSASSSDQSTTCSCRSDIEPRTADEPIDNDRPAMPCAGTKESDFSDGSIGDTVGASDSDYEPSDLEADSNDEEGPVVDTTRGEPVNSGLQKSENFACSICNEKFPSVAFLSTHKIHTHAEKKEFKCDQCDKAYFNKYHLKEHAMLHSKKFQCSICKRVFRRKSEVTHHKLTSITCLDQINTDAVGANSDQSDFECIPCNLCDKKYSSEHMLQKHKRQSHSGNRRFACDLCNKTYRAHSHLKEHHTWAHTSLRRFKCRTCDRGFLRSGDLDRHKDFHRRSNPNLTGDEALEATMFAYVCLTCNEEFPSLLQLKSHESTVHQMNRFHSCSECGEQFHTRKLLQSHESEIHESQMISNKSRSCLKALKCKLCGAKHLPSKQPHGATFYKRVSGWPSKIHQTSQKGKINVKGTTRVWRRKRNRCLQCMTCGGNFQKLSSYKKHQEIHAAGGEVNFCRSCGSHFKTSRHLYRHRLMFHSGKKSTDQVKDPTEEPRKCEKCQREIANRNFLIKHLSEVHTKQMCLHSCDKCQASFQTVWRLKAHKQQMHPVGLVKLYVCTVCNKGFYWQYCLRKHKEVHSGKAEFACKFCQALFKTEQCLLAHKCKKNKSGRDFMCDVCGKLFAGAIGLQIHKAVHSTQPRQFICEHCGKRFSGIRGLRKHKTIRCHETKEFICPFCGKSYPKNNYLAAHIRIHRDKQRTCKICQKVFKHQKTLTEHIKRLHTDLRPFACNLCPNKFKSRFELRKHQNIHTGAKPYKCKVCGDAFVQNGTLYRHMKGVHRQGRKTKRNGSPPKQSQTKQSPMRRSLRKRSPRR